MELAGLVESEKHVCARYRLALFAERLRAAGVNLTLYARPKSLVGRVALYRQLRRADAVVVQRMLLSGAEVAVLRRYARYLVFDFDDAVWLRDSYHPRGTSSPRRSARFRAVAGCADLVLAGNDFLAEYAERFARPGRVRVVPTCVDPSDYPTATHTARGADARLTWVGSGSTLRGLARAGDHFAAVGASVPGIRLRVVCDRGLELPGVSVDVVPWGAATEGRDLAAADLGVSWVPDDEWSRGKCGLKLVQYLAAGLPAVTNPVGVHPNVIGPDAGVLATTPGEWSDAVRTLADDPALRARMGAAGRGRVEAHFSARAGADLWLRALGRAEAACA